MNKRLLLITLIIMLVIGGLLVSGYSASIQRALTLPMASLMGKNPAAGSADIKAQPRNGGPPNPLIVPKQNAGGMQAQANPIQANVLAQDSFQRTNQQFWGVSSDARKWEGDANSSKAFSINGASGQIAHGQGTANAILGPVNDNVDVLASGSVNQFGDGVNLGVVLRWTNSQNWYKALIDGNHLSILKRVNGKTTQIGTVPFNAQNGTVYKLRFRAIGVMLFTKIWRVDQPEPGAWMITVSDADLKTGQSGLRVVVQPKTIITVTSFLSTPANMGNDA